MTWTMSCGNSDDVDGWTERSERRARAHIPGPELYRQLGVF